MAGHADSRVDRTASVQGISGGAPRGEGRQLCSDFGWWSGAPGEDQTQDPRAEARCRFEPTPNALNGSAHAA